MEQVRFAVDAELRVEGKKWIEVDPTTFVQYIASKLRSNPSQPFAEFGRGFFRVGQSDHVPEKSPEDERLIGELETRHVPTIDVMKTSRPEEAW